LYLFTGTLRVTAVVLSYECLRAFWFAAGIENIQFTRFCDCKVMNIQNKNTTRYTPRTHHRIYSRISDIHKMIASCTYPSIEKLAHRLNVNPRTIKRDIAALRDQFNAPIEYDRQRRGFYYTLPEWTLPVQKMQEGDLLAFFIAENAMRLVGFVPEAMALRKALSKIASMLPETISVNLCVLNDMVRFENAPHVNVDLKLLERLSVCSISRETVEFDYYSPHNQKTKHRIADVHLLHNFAGDWYAISYDHEAGDFRDFHVGRISNLKTTGQTFNLQRGWDAETYLRRGFQMMRGGRLTNVSICFDSYQAQWIRERSCFHPDEKREDLPDGGLRLSFKIGEKGLDAVARFCLMYSGHCRIEKPKRLREIVIEKLRSALTMHDNLPPAP